ncbi:MAG: superoxide dismutase family protein [Planctomycetes bacterium]|nr:superoxide dismutase family protein [Planctomycetota bacterium]
MKLLSTGLALSLALLANSCALVDKPNVSRAAAVLDGRVLEHLTGLAVFTETSDGVRVSLSVQGAPSGVHGVFVCDGPTCSASGGHFNPGREAHGSRASSSHHAGDLGNLIVNADGVGTLDVLCPDLSVNTRATSVIGKVLVLTERADDLTTQPSGDAGAKLACGEILADRRPSN